MSAIRRSTVTLLATSLLMVSLTAPALAADPPDLIRVVGVNTITQGMAKHFKVEVTGFETGGTFVVSGTGVALIAPHGGIKPSADPNVLRVKFEATADAEVGLRDLTVINPDGQTDTLVDAIEVLPGTVVPDTGISGHVFSDGNGNGVKDDGEVGLSGAEVLITDAAGSSNSYSTDSAGNYLAVGLAAGDASVAYTTPSDATLTTANDAQTITVVGELIVNASDVGYQGAAAPAVDILSIVGGDVARGGRATYRVTVTGADPAATWSVSGFGVTIARVIHGSDLVRLSVTVAVDADLGPHDLTVVNPDGQTDTLGAAINVTE